MRQYGCLQAIAMSFYSRELYRDVAKNWRGGVLLYLLLLLGICWAVLCVNIQKQANVGYGKFSDKFFSQIPEMSIKSGELKTPENRPYLILDTDKQVVGIIDTSGKYHSLENTTAEFLITKNAIYYKDKGDIKKGHEFSSNLNVDFKPVEVKHSIGVFINWSWVLLFPLFVIVTFIYRLVQSALYAVLGEIFVVIWRVQLTYGEIFRMAIFAITPSIVISTILEWFSISFSYLWLLYFVLSMGYLIFAIRSNKL